MGYKNGFFSCLVHIRFMSDVFAVGDAIFFGNSGVHDTHRASILN